MISHAIAISSSVLQLDPAGLIWFEPATANLNCGCKACYMPSGKFHCCLVMLLIDKLDTDAMHQMPMMESCSLLLPKSHLFYELTLMWYLAIKLTAPGVESPIILALIKLSVKSLHNGWTDANLVFDRCNGLHKRHCVLAPLLLKEKQLRFRLFKRQISWHIYITSVLKCSSVIRPGIKFISVEMCGSVISSEFITCERKL